MKKTLKELWKIAQTKNKPLMMTDTYENSYPVIDDNLSNFITDYLADHAKFDKYVLFHHGSKSFYFDEDIEPDVWEEWKAVIDSIMAIHLDSWARLYYALSLQYNPIWNVDGVETQEYGNTHSETTFGQSTDTSTYGATSVTSTIGQLTTTSTTATRNNESATYEKTYDSGTEKQTGRTTSKIDGGVDSVAVPEHTITNAGISHIDTLGKAEHTDTVESDTHTDTLTRHGNIGVTMTQQLLSAEIELRKKNFFKEVFETILVEGGLSYDD